jgi:hypothetical protein
MADFPAEVWASPPLSGSVPPIDAAREAAAYGPRFKMRGKRLSTGATVRWMAYRAEDLTGARSPFPGDIDVSSIVRE